MVEEVKKKYTNGKRNQLFKRRNYETYSKEHEQDAMKIK